MSQPGALCLLCDEGAGAGRNALPGRLPIPTRGARRGVAVRARGTVPPRPPEAPRRGGGGGLPSAPLGTTAPDCALSPAAGGQSPGRKSAPHPGQAPGPPPQRGPSRHPPRRRRRRRPLPPPSAPPAPPFSAQDTHQVSCRSGRRAGRGGAGERAGAPAAAPTLPKSLWHHRSPTSRGV